MKTGIRAVVSLSGGMDSTTVLGMALENRRQVEAVGFYYGSKHGRLELDAAEKVANHYKVPFRVIDISKALSGIRSNLLQTGGEIPTGHYQEDNMKQTVVPGRNTIFTAMLVAIAESDGFDEIHLGIHSGDHVIYPDCRPAWLYGMAQAVQCATENKVGLVAPFLGGDKITIIRDGLRIGVPYHLTRTCYTSDEIACGKCGSCQERLEAFGRNGVADPIPYQSRTLLPKNV